MSILRFKAHGEIEESKKKLLLVRWGDLGTPEMSVKCSEQAGNGGRVAARSGRSERNSE